MKAAHWFALVPLVLLGSASGADVTLLAPGAPAPVIVAVGESEVTAEVAAELARYIGAMTGIEPAIIAGPDAAADAPRIVLGLVENEMTPESFRLRAVGNSVVISAADAPGLWFGMYTLLEELGCRFYFPGDLGENVPATDTLALPEIDRLESPDFIHRNVWWAYGSRPAWQRSLYVDWQRKAKMGGVKASMGHNLYRIVPPAEFGEAHPEYYPLIDGERRVPADDAIHNWQPCTTNPEVVQLAIDAAIKYFDARPDAFSFSLSPNDGYGWCRCDACVAQDPEQYREYANRGKGRRMLIFANQVAEGLALKHPDKYVAWYAYAGAVEPPADVKAHPNVVTVIAHYGWCGCSIHPIEDPDCHLNASFREVMDGWAKVAGRIFVREYFTTLVSATDVLARDVGAYSLAQDTPYFKAHNVVGVNSESIPDYGAGGLNFFLAGKLMWDADQPLEPLLVDWYEGLYGPAAPTMRSYTETIVSLCRGRGHRGDFFEPQDIDLLVGKLDEAAGLAETDKQRARIAMAREAMDYMVMMRAYAAKPTKEVREEIAAFVDAIEEGQRLSIDFVRHRASMNARQTVLPDSLKQFAGMEMRPVSTDPMPEDAAAGRLVLRGNHALAILLERGERLTGQVAVRRLGRYLNPTCWAVLDPDGETVVEGIASVEGPSDLDHVAAQAGTYVLAMASSSNACSARIDNQHVSLVGPSPHFLSATPWMYFYVLDGVDAAAMYLRTDAPGETGKLIIRDPAGAVVFEEETGAATDRVTAQLPVTAENAGRVWSLRITGASTGVCEDLTLTLGEGIAEALATHPSRLLVKVE